jgi:hypothetical protein
MLGLDPVVTKVQKIVLDSAKEMRGGRSLRVDEATIHAFCRGQPEAVAVVNSWQFQANRGTRIITVIHDEYAQMISRNEVNFGV